MDLVANLFHLIDEGQLKKDQKNKKPLAVQGVTFGADDGNRTRITSLGS